MNTGRNRQMVTGLGHHADVVRIGEPEAVDASRYASRAKRERRKRYYMAKQELAVALSFSERLGIVRQAAKRNRVDLTSGLLELRLTLGEEQDRWDREVRWHHGKRRPPTESRRVRRLLSQLEDTAHGRGRAGAV